MTGSMLRGVVLTIMPVFLLACFSCSPVPPDHPAIPASPATAIRVLVTSDVHGHVFEDPDQGRIGYALLKGYADRAAEQATTILLDAGDAFSGSALAQFDSGRTVAELMGVMGYRILTPGNHAFDFNVSEDNPLHYPETLIPAVSRSSTGPVEALCLNPTWHGGPVPGIVNQPVVIHEQDGLRLVVAGVLTPYAATKTIRAGLDGLDFGLVETDGIPDHAATRRLLLAALATALAPYDRPDDIVIVLSHVGWDISAEYSAGQISGKDLAAVPNVDILVDAHSHLLVEPERIGSALYGQAGRYLEHFAEISLDRVAGRWTAGLAIRGYADLGDIPPSQAMLTRLRAAADRMGLGDELFRVDSADLFTDDDIALGNLPLGRLLCRTMQDITRADLALYNSGGIRSGLSPGWVTAGAVYDMIPFQNNLITAAMTGGEILDLFNTLPPRGANGFPQFYGMTAYCYESDGRLRTVGLHDADGRPLSPTTSYRVALNSFMASGGDGFVFPPELRHDHGDAATAIVTYLRTHDIDGFATLRDASPLRIFPDRAKAEAAFARDD